MATISQIFSGLIAGSALLLLDYQGAVLLSILLGETPATERFLTTVDREVLTEVGNIVLNACLGTFGSLLQVHISFMVPRVHVESLEGLLRSLTIGTEELQYALVILTDFHLRDSSVGGFLVIVLGVASLKLLIESAGNLG